MVDLGKLWRLEPKPLTWGQIGDYNADWSFCCASSRFCRLSLSIIVWAPERLNWSPALLTEKCNRFCQKCKIFAIMTSFDLENIDLGSQNLCLKEFLYRHTYPPNFVFLALTGAKIAGVGGRFCPASRARNSQTLSREHVNIHNYYLNWSAISQLAV